MNKTQQETWNTLQQAGLTTSTEAPQTGVETPWFVRLLQGVAGWMAALLILAFIGVSFWSLFREEYARVAIVLAVIAHAVAWPLLSKHSNEFLDQLGLAISLCGQFLMAFGLLAWFSYGGTWGFMILGLYQLLLVYVMPNAVHRFLSAFFAVISLTWGFRYSAVLDWLQLCTSIAIVLVFIFESKWGARRNIWQPFAYGLACSALVIDGFWLSGAHLLVPHLAQIAPVFWWLHLVVSLALWLFVLAHIARSLELSLSAKSVALFVVAIVLAVVLYYTTGSLNSLLILFLGFYRKRPILLAIGVLSLVGFVSWYYYSLHISLLQKSMLLLVSGGVFFILWAAMTQLFKSLRSDSDQDVQSTPFGGRWVIVLMLLVILAVLNTGIWKKERLLDHGQVVLLQLAPVDPRSLMQGDYMRLRFAIENDYRASQTDENMTDGFVVVGLDANDVAQFKGLHQNRALQTDETLLHYRIRGHRVQFGTDAFFFQEGNATVYEQAEYGEFRVSEKGDMMLVGLRNAAFEVLGRTLF